MAPEFIKKGTNRELSGPISTHSMVQINESHKPNFFVPQSKCTVGKLKIDRSAIYKIISSSAWPFAQSGQSSLSLRH